MSLSLPDVQAEAPGTLLGLSRAGVANVEKVVRIGQELLSIRLDCAVELGPQARGAHMSRFEDAANAAIDEAVLDAGPLRVETLAGHIAERVRAHQGAERAFVTLSARRPEHRLTPVSQIPTHEVHTLLARASASAHAPTRTTLGVAAHGMTACPCAQGLLAARARERLEQEEGFAPDEVDRILAAVPVAAHNQRGIATLELGLADGAPPVDATGLLRIAEDAMSSETYELMKREDEAAVVEKAHRRPRFVEDCVREMLRGVVERLPGLPDETWVSARQENLETIHAHDVVAERFGLLGDIRRELETGDRAGADVTRGEWLTHASATPRSASA